MEMVGVRLSNGRNTKKAKAENANNWNIVTTFAKWST